MINYQQRYILPMLVATILSILIACTQDITVYWSKPQAGVNELQHDKEECQALQRSVGAKEWRIHSCLEAKGWAQAHQTEE